MGLKYPLINGEKPYLKILNMLVKCYQYRYLSFWFAIKLIFMGPRKAIYKFRSKTESWIMSEYGQIKEFFKTVFQDRLS
jgi:hypothetical protein